MTRYPIVTVFLLLTAGPASAAGVLGDALSYTKPVPGGYTFAMLGDPAAEAKQPADARRKFEELRTKYPRTGLYRDGSNDLVWAVEDGGYAHYDYVYPAADGVHLVRIDGEWWRTKDFTGGRARLPAEEEQKQLDAPGMSFFANGKLVKRYPVRELVTDPARLPHTPQHVLWLTSGSLNEETGRFVLFTQDANRVTFDYRTGEAVSRGKAGLSNPLLTTILVVSGALAVVVLGVWAYLAFVRWRRPAAVSPA